MDAEYSWILWQGNNCRQFCFPNMKLVYWSVPLCNRRGDGVKGVILARCKFHFTNNISIGTSLYFFYNIFSKYPRNLPVVVIMWDQMFTKLIRLNLGTTAPTTYQLKTADCIFPLSRQIWKTAVCIFIVSRQNWTGLMFRRFITLM